MRELGDKLQANDRQQVEELINQLREAMQGEDITRIRNLSEQLQQATYAFSQQLYQTQQGAGPEAQAGQGANGGDEDVVEGEFQEL